MRTIWLSVVTLVCLTGFGQAQEVRWQRAASRPEWDHAPAPTTPAAKLGRPIPQVTPAPPPDTLAGITNPTAPRFVVRAQAQDFPGSIPPPPPPPPGGFGSPPPPPPPPPQGAPGAPPPPPPPPEDYLCGKSNHTARSGGGNFFTEIPAAVGGFFAPCDGRALFQSDHKFDCIVSPVSNPFFFEDPRALTEVKPLFIYQRTPGDNPVYAGGDIWFAGLQARVALTDRLGLVLSKFGWMSQEVNNPTGDVYSGSGFAEMSIGPKYAIIRNPDTQTLLTLGLSFDIPTGSGNVVQNTGDLSLRPYLSFGQNFLKFEGIGSFNFLNTTGYSFSTDNQRTDYFYSSFHLDFDVLGWHRIYPLIELNWFYYAQNGGARQLGFEGRDLINFGSDGVSGQNNVSLAFGARYKFLENIQMGATIEFPLVGDKDLMDWRITFDMIFRY